MQTGQKESQSRSQSEARTMTIVQHEAGPKFVECTPLWTSFLENLDGFGDNSDGNEILEFLSEKCFHKETLYVDDK